MSKFCVNCGTPLPEGANVCPNCGTPIAVVNAEPVSEAPADQTVSPVPVEPAQPAVPEEPVVAEQPAAPAEPAVPTEPAEPEFPIYDEEPSGMRWWVVALIIFLVALLGGGGFFGWQWYDDKQDWSRISESDNVKDFKNHMDRLICFHSYEAKAKYKELKEIEDKWKKIEAEQDFDDYRRFTKEYPDSRYCSVAVERMDSIAWAEAVEEDEPGAYMDYVYRMPKGKHVAEAKAKAENMQLHEMSYYESDAAESAIRNFFDAVENNNLDGAIALFPAEFKLNGRAANKVSLINYLRGIYAEDVWSLNITTSNFNVEKEVAEDHTSTYKVDFNVDIITSREYEDAETFVSNIGTAVVDSNGMITSLTIRKVSGM